MVQFFKETSPGKLNPPEEEEATKKKKKSKGEIVAVIRDCIEKLGGMRKFVAEADEIVAEADQGNVTPGQMVAPGGAPPPQQAELVQGQELLTASMLAAALPQEQKQMLGERLFPLIQRMFPDLAGKITGKLLELDNAELVHMLEDQSSLRGKVEEAVSVLLADQGKA